MSIFGLFSRRKIASAPTLQKTSHWLIIQRPYQLCWGRWLTICAKMMDRSTSCPSQSYGFGLWSQQFGYFVSTLTFFIVIKVHASTWKKVEKWTSVFFVSLAFYKVWFHILPFYLAWCFHLKETWWPAFSLLRFISKQQAIVSRHLIWKFNFLLTNIKSLDSIKNSLYFSSRCIDGHILVRDTII